MTCADVVEPDISEEDEKEEESVGIYRPSKLDVVGEKIMNTEEEIARNKAFWKEKLASCGIKYVVAPMVDQSELAFRMFLRKYGAHLTVTPMIHAHLFVNDTTYRKNSLSFVKEDRPLIVQFCANNPDTFLSACRLVEGYCDGVDLNLGCPQMVAKRGHYGSYLQDEVDLICEMVSNVRNYCKLPISCKIRVRDCREQTINYAKRLVEAGACMLTVHGRTRDMRGAETGIADWSRIKDIVDSVDVPVIANGNIQMPGDVDRCLEATGAAAVMSAEGILYNPLLFADEHRESYKVGEEYLQFAKRYKANVSAIRAHIFRIMHHSLLEYDDLRRRVSIEHSIESFASVVDEIRSRVECLLLDENHSKAVEAARQLFDEIRKGNEIIDPVKVTMTPHWLSKPYFRLPPDLKAQITLENGQSSKEKRKEELQRMADEMGLSLKQAKKRERRKLVGQRAAITKKTKFPPCVRCSQPAGQDCKYCMCKRCCKYSCKRKRLDCNPHRAKWSHLSPMKEEEKEEDSIN